MLALFSRANGVGPALSGLRFDYVHGYTHMVYENTVGNRLRPVPRPRS